MGRKNEDGFDDGGIPHMVVSDNAHYASKTAKATLGATLLVAMVVVGGYFLLPSTSPSRLAAYKNPHVGLRAIIHHKSKHVCSTPKRGQASCMAQISVTDTGAPLVASPSSSGAYGPVQFHTAYNLPCTPGGAVASVCSTPSSYGPETIAIVDAGNFSTGASGLETSLQDYDSYYGLPACTVANSCLTVVNQSGSTSSLPADAGWSDEIALDVETAHLVCQTCKLVLVESNDSTATNLAAADSTAATFNPVAISNSWGSSTDIPSLDSEFERTGIAVVASTGDSGTVSTGASWPSDIPNVVAASGTTLQLNADNTWSSETVWSGSGGGCSNYYAAPSWQTTLSEWGTNGCGGYRAFGDVSADADPSTGAAVNINGSWYEIGGTSLSAPLIASIYALAGGLPSATIGSNVPYQANTAANFHDITSGNDCTSSNTTNCTAATGFDMPSGLGTPNGIGGFVALPTQPTLTATIASQTEIDLSWTASSSLNGIDAYYVYRDGTKVATVTAPSTTYKDTGLTPNTVYNYDVVAHDTTGNLSLASISVSVRAAYAEDINADGHINLLDLSVLAGKYGQSGSNLGRADINGDGKVDLLDLSLLAGKYGSE